MNLCQKCSSRSPQDANSIMPAAHLVHLALASTSEAGPSSDDSPSSSPTTTEDTDPYLELDELNKSIANVEAYLAQLVRQRLPIKTRINRLKSPILRMLPPELLSRIFSFYIPDFHEHVGKGIKPTSNPLTLGAICRTWRNVAWSTPELWTTISLHLSFSKITILSPLVAEWLGRSGQLPLDIRLWCGAGEDRKLSDPHVFSMLNILSRYSSRWRALELKIPTTFFSGFTYNEDDSLILSSLHLDPPDGQADRTERFTFGTTPRLTKLHISSIYLKAISIQWSNITHIHASAFYFDECLEILQRCPLLVWCEFSSIINGEDGYTIPGGVIKLAHLTYFRLCNDGPILPTDVLTKISAPSLEEFFFQAGGRPVHADDIASFVNRSGCSSTLRTFGLSRGDLSQADLIRVLECMPGLKKLSIKAEETFNLNLTDEVVQRLSSGCMGGKNVAAKPLLPRLETFEYAGTQSFGWRPFMDMLCNYGRVMGSSLSNSNLAHASVSTSGSGSGAFGSETGLAAPKDIPITILGEVVSSPSIGYVNYPSGTAASTTNSTKDGTQVPLPSSPPTSLPFSSLHLAPIITRADCPGDQHTLHNVDLSFTTHDSNDPILIDREHITVLLDLMDSGALSLQVTHLHGSKDLLASSVTANCPEEEERYQNIRAKLDASTSGLIMGGGGFR